MDDFNAFATSSGRSEPRRNPAPKRKKQVTYELDLKTLIIAAVSLVAFILLIVIIVAVANSANKNIIAKNNSFVSYESNGNYYVAMNGDIVGEPFENEVAITVAEDNSFAYVVEDTSEGYKVYILESKKISQVIANPVSEVLALAKYQPGIIYKEEDSVYFYADDNEDRITKDPSADHFIISDDASAAAYTVAKEDNANEFKLYLFTDGISESYANNMYPVEVSNGGEYIYAYGISVENLQKKLYVILTKDNERLSIVSGFEKITYSNIDHDEIIYYTGSLEQGFQSYIYNLKKDKSFRIGAGICVPLIPDKSVARLSSLKDFVVENIFFAAESTGTSATYYVNKKYDSSKISSYNGQLTLDSSVFYFINNDGNLSFIEVTDKNPTPEKVAEGVIEFVITEKDNVYYLDDEAKLWFYKSSSARKTKIPATEDILGISMNRYSNIVYFEMKDSSSAYMTEEGSTSEEVKFDRKEIASMPMFTDSSQKRTFAYILDPETELYNLYYTSSGKTYKLLASECSNINSGSDKPSLIQKEINDILG